jgi:hypothetical protein
MKPDEIRNAIDGVVIQWENGVLPKHQSLTDAIADAIIARLYAADPHNEEVCLHDWADVECFGGTDGWECTICGVIQ